MYSILGIDQSIRSTGVVILNGDGSVRHHEVITTDRHTDNLVADYQFRSEQILRQLQFIEYSNSVTHSCCELPSMASVGNATRTLSWLFGGILRVFPLITTMAPTSLKKFATNKGNATKEEMVSAVEAVNPDMYSILMNTPKTKGRYDLADAYWLAYYTLQGIK